MNADGSFVILQVNDLLYNGDPTDNQFTDTLLQNLLKNLKPNLVVITGDIVEPSKWRQYEVLFKQAMDLFLKS